MPTLAFKLPLAWSSMEKWFSQVNIFSLMMLELSGSSKKIEEDFLLPVKKLFST